MTVRTDLGPCECCCPGCGWAVLVFSPGLCPLDDMDIYLNGVLLYTLRETQLTGPGCADPYACHGWWLTPASPVTVAPPAGDMVADGCTGTPAITTAALAALNHPTDKVLNFEFHSVVFNEGPEYNYVTINLYRVCSDTGNVFLESSDTHSNPSDFVSFGSVAEVGDNSYPKTGGELCWTADNTGTEYPPHTDRQGATQFLCCGDVRIPYTLTATFSGFAGPCTLFDWLTTVGLTLNVPVSVDPFPHDEWVGLATGPGGGYDFELGCGADGTWGFAINGGFHDTSVTVISCDPFHVQFGFSVADCTFTVDVTE